MCVEDNVDGFACHLMSGLSRIESNEKIWFYFDTPTKTKRYPDLDWFTFF